MALAEHSMADVLSDALKFVNDESLATLERFFYAIEALHLDQHARQLSASATEDLNRVGHLLVDEIGRRVPDSGELLCELNLARAGQELKSGRTWHVGGLLERAAFFAKADTEHAGLLSYYRGLVAWQNQLTDLALEHLREVQEAVSSNSLWESSRLLQITILRTTGQIGSAQMKLRSAGRWQGMTSHFYERLQWQGHLIDL